MKKIIITILISTFAFMLSAQANFKIEKRSVVIENQSNEAIIVDMKADKDEAKSAWNDYIQDVHKIDIKGYGFFKKKDELTTEPIAIAFLSEENLILNTYFSGDENSTTMRIFAQKEDGRALNPEQDGVAINNLHELSEEFIADFLPEYYGGEVENAQKLYDEGLDSFASLGEDVDSKTKEIEELQEEIADLRVERKEMSTIVDKRKKELDKMSRIYSKVVARTKNL